MHEIGSVQPNNGGREECLETSKQHMPPWLLRTQMIVFVPSVNTWQISPCHSVRLLRHHHTWEAQTKETDAVEHRQPGTGSNPGVTQSWLTWTICFPRRRPHSPSWKPGKFTLVRILHNSSIPASLRPLERQSQSNQPHTLNKQAPKPERPDSVKLQETITCRQICIISKSCTHEQSIYGPYVLFGACKPICSTLCNFKEAS